MTHAAFVCPICDHPVRHQQHGHRTTNIYHCDHCQSRFTREALEELERVKLKCVPDAEPLAVEETSPPKVEESGLSALSAKLQSLKEKK